MSAIPIFAALLSSLASGAAAAQHLRNAQALEPAFPGFISDAPSAAELDVWAQSDAADNHGCRLSGEGTFPPESLTVPEDLQLCADRGLEDIMQFARPFPVLDKHKFMPVFSSHGFTRRSKGITHAVIWIHGGRMNANKYACDALNVTAAAGAANQTLTIVPFFSDMQMSLRQWSGDTNASADQVSVCWNNSNAWMSGSESAYDSTTAFGMLDWIVLALQTDLANVFPDLERIVVTGFSAGCQMLQRWSFFSNVLSNRFSKTPVTLILGSCGSYMYLDRTRPAKSCRPLMHSGSNHTCDKFKRPQNDYCQDYDTYKFGLSLHEKKHSGYLRSFGEYGTFIRSRRKEFFHKDIRFLFGDVDGCNCNIQGYYNPTDMCFPAIGKQCTSNAHGGSSGGHTCCDTYPGNTDNHVGHICQARLQGSNRLQRGLNYMGHLRDFYKRRGHTYTPVFGIFAGAHDSSAAYSSERFRRWVFGDIPNITHANGTKAGWSKARYPQEDLYAIDWDTGPSDDYSWSGNYDDSPLVKPQQPQQPPLPDTVIAEELDDAPADVGETISGTEDPQSDANPAHFVATTASTAGVDALPPLDASPWVPFRGNWN